MTSHDDDARQRPSARLRAGLVAGAVAAVLLAAAAGGSPAGAAPASGRVAAVGGYLYWANTAPLRNGAGTIGRARLDGTDVDQKFITGASLPIGVTAAGGYLYWANNGTGTIGRAKLDGTDVNEKFITVPDGVQPVGLRGVAVDPGPVAARAAREAGERCTGAAVRLAGQNRW